METSDRIHPAVPGDDAPHLLVVDDDTRIRNLLKQYLTENGFRVTVAGNAAEARRQLTGLDFDLLVLDVMMPGENGVELTRSLRGDKNVPILMLTALSETDSRIAGLEAGADDYLPKPFELGILLARVGGLLRRRRWNERDVPPPSESTSDSFTFAGRTLDFTAMEIRAHGQTHRLTQMECDLLRYLVTHPGQVISRGTLLENVWGLHESTDTRAIDNFVVRLRKYLEDRPSTPQFLLTVRGVGYKFQP
jgi:two-component system phosphate regulon response regulator OmpR